MLKAATTHFYCLSVNHIFQTSVLIMECNLTDCVNTSKRSEAANQSFLYWIEWNTSLSLEYRLWSLTHSLEILLKNRWESSFFSTAWSRWSKESATCDISFFSTRVHGCKRWIWELDGGRVCNWPLFIWFQCLDQMLK